MSLLNRQPLQYVMMSTKPMHHLLRMGRGVGVGNGKKKNGRGNRGKE